MKLHEPIAPTSPCMPALPRTCTTCAFHQRTPVAEGAIHLCTLPPQCAPLELGDDDDDHERDQEERLSAYLGTSCDVMRRMGALCGPHAHLWRAVDGR